MRFRFNISLLFFLIVFISIAWGVVLIILHTPNSGRENTRVMVEIKKGESFAHITAKLYQYRLIENPQLFYFITRIFYNTKKFQAGKHLFDGKLSYDEVIEILKDSENELITVFIPEGARLKDIYKKLKKLPLENNKQYESIVLNENILSHKNNFKIKSLEGFLYPDTYYISKDFTERQVISLFLNTFKKRLPQEFVSRAKELNLTGYELLILASIIEKETASEEERKYISSVFHNRLKKKMRLQTDPTVIYGIKNFNGNLRKKHLKTYTPYNTYLITGLPPTPISNPSLNSMLAAMYPAKSKYLYFVAKGDGTSYFSKNLREHINAVNRFQKKRNKNYRSTPKK